MDLKYELYSWRKWLIATFPSLFPSNPIYDERARGIFARPGIRLEEASHVSLDTGGRGSGWLDQRTMSLIYFATSFDNMLTVEYTIIEKLKRDKYVKGYLTNFTYPEPYIEEYDSIGSAIGGTTVYVLVTGLRSSQESLGSEVEKSVTANKGLLIRPDRFPFGAPWFQEYNVYVYGTSGAPKLHTKIVQPNQGWIELSVNTLGVGAVAPVTSEIEAGHLMIGDINVIRTEDSIENGAWNLTINVNTQSIGVPYREQDVSTIKYVNPRLEVS